MKRKRLVLLLCAVALYGLQSCAGNANAAMPQTTPEAAQVRGDQVSWPKEKLELDPQGTPMLRVYNTDTQKVESVDVETYVQGVLAGEMKNDWPLEALKAQAILARTFVLKFVEEKESKYPNADISTDIEEAQAYDASAVNDRIRQAVAETRGLVLVSGNQLPYAWFHAHSGGVTERAVSGLGWDREEPPYTQAVESKEPETVQNEKDAQALKQAQSWEASFSAQEFAAACAKQGVKVSVSQGTKLAVEQRGESGRAVSISVDGQSVKATELRIALGSTKMRSTLLTSLKLENGQVKMAGKGYGHGVGMSQWGAYAMAEQGKTAEEIVTHYFRNVAVAQIWN